MSLQGRNRSAPSSAGPTSRRYHPIVQELLHRYDNALLEHAAGCCGVDFDRDILCASPGHELVARDAVFECLHDDVSQQSSPHRQEHATAASDGSDQNSASRRRCRQHLTIVLPARISPTVDINLLRELVPYHPNKKKFLRQLRLADGVVTNSNPINSPEEEERRNKKRSAEAEEESVAIGVEDLLNDTTATSASAASRNHSAASDRHDGAQGGGGGDLCILHRPLASDELVELSLAIDRFNKAQKGKEQTLSHYRDVCNALHQQEEIQANNLRLRQQEERAEEQRKISEQKELENLLLLERQAIAQKMALRDELERQRAQADAERQEQLEIQRACLLQSEYARAQARDEAAARQRAEDERRARFEHVRLQAEIAERNFKEAQEAAEHRKFLLLHSREVALREKSEAKKARLQQKCQIQKEEQERKARELLELEKERRTRHVESAKSKRTSESSESSARRQAAYLRAAEAAKSVFRQAELKMMDYAHRVQHMEEEQRRRQQQQQQEAEEAQQHRAHAAALARARAEARRQEAEELAMLQEARRQETAQARDLQRKLLEAEAKVKEDERRERIERAARAKEYRDAQFRRQLEEKDGSAHGQVSMALALVKPPRRPAASAGFARTSVAVRPVASASTYSTLRRQLTEIKDKGATAEAANALDSFLQDIHRKMVDLRQQKQQQ